MRVVTDATLKVHTDAKTGSVWLIDGDGPPGDTGRDSERFAAELPPGPLTVRVLGFRENARLISSLYRRRPAHPGLSVEVGRPVVVPWEQLDGQGPEHVLFEIRQLAVQCPSSMGGWHALTDREYAGYALTALLNSGPADAHHVADLLGRHAAWPALSFITHLDLQATAQVLAEIGDPRWFIDPERPDSMSRLRSYFGLPPAEGARTSARRAHRRDLLRRAWARPFADIREPGAFLWRHAKCHHSAARAELATSQYFLAYLRHSWLDSLCGDAVRKYVREGAAVAHDQGLFIPEHFFKRPEDASSFRRHAAAGASIDPPGAAS
jgi:hypothetical protein